MGCIVRLITCASIRPQLSLSTHLVNDQRQFAFGRLSIECNSKWVLDTEIPDMYN